MSTDENSGDCDAVAGVVSGKFRADYYGNWDSSPNYDDSRAVYEVDFKSYRKSPSQLAGDIADIEAIVDAVGEKVTTYSIFLIFFCLLNVVSMFRANTEIWLGILSHGPLYKQALRHQGKAR